jgi:hypothetical protein
MAALPAWVPYAVMAAGTVAKMKGDERTADEKRGIINRSMEDTQKQADKAAAAVAAEGAQYSPEQRAIDMKAQEQGAFQRAQADLGGSSGIVDSSAKGNVSAEFLKAKAGKAVTEGNRITEIAREMARARAPGEQMTQEGLRRADMAGKIGSDWSTTNNMARAAQQTAANIGPNSLSNLGTVATAIGSAWAGGAGGALGGAGSQVATSGDNPEMYNSELYTYPQARAPQRSRINFGGR